MNDSEITHAHIVERLDKLEAKLEPIIETWQDVAALGRSGRILGRFMLWSGGLVVAFLAVRSFLIGDWG